MAVIKKGLEYSIICTLYSKVSEWDYSNMFIYEFRARGLIQAYSQYLCP